MTSLPQILDGPSLSPKVGVVSEFIIFISLVQRNLRYRHLKNHWFFLRRYFDGSQMTVFVLLFFLDSASTTSSLILLHQLEDKMKAHDHLLSFLQNVGVWDRVSPINPNHMGGGGPCSFGKCNRSITSGIELLICKWGGHECVLEYAVYTHRHVSWGPSVVPFVIGCKQFLTPSLRE